MKLDKKFFIEHQSRISVVLALIGGIVYAIRSWGFAHTITSFNLDESMYMYKGYLFVTGKYILFEDFGPLTNHMPLSYLIPGYAQALFGPGLQTGRMFSYAIGLLALFGSWFAVKRLSGYSWAAFTVWVYALNIAWVKSYSLGFSQVLVWLFLSWCLVFVFGEGRNNELVIAGILAGLLGMTRINLMPVLFFVCIYSVWQYGWGKGKLLVLSLVGTVLLIHLIYWPNILKMWAYWIPTDILPGILEYKAPWGLNLPDTIKIFPISEWLDDPEHNFWSSFRALWMGIRFNFVAIFGPIVTLILWPKREYWKNDSSLKTTIFLFITFTFLFIIHAWASLSGRSCTYECFIGYVMFFGLLGIVLIASSFSSWRKDIPAWGTVLIIIFVASFLYSIEINYGFNYFETGREIVNFFDTPMPRYKNFEFLPGTVPLWSILENKFNYDHFPLRRYVLYDQSFIFVVRWVKVLSVFILIYILYRLFKRYKIEVYNFGRFTLISTLVFGIVYSSSNMFGGGMEVIACEDDVLESHEIVSKELLGIVIPDTLLLWDVKSSILLLYLKDVDIFPPLLNSSFSFVPYDGIDPDLLNKYGFWNQDSYDQWSIEADIIAVEKKSFEDYWEEKVDQGEFEIIFTSSPVESCRGDDSRILILQKID